MTKPGAFIFLFVFAAYFNMCQAQTTGDTSAVFDYVEQMPEFDGDMYKWLGSNIVYPSKSRKKNEQGRAVLQFIIEKDGTLTHVNIVKSSAHERLDKEAVRVIKSMPAWKPGKQNGKTVRVRYTLPIHFKLS